jgi:hypothetical protein
MKLPLPTIEKTAQLKYRVAESIKAELDGLRKECESRNPKLGFTAALEHGLREVAKALRAQLYPDAEPKAELKIEPSPEPANRLTNGPDPEGA